MKQSLKVHISNILTTLHIEVPVEIYACKEDTLPVWTKEIPLTHEFLVCCEVFPERNRLQAFIGKSLFAFENHLYWFEGDNIKTIEQVEIVPPPAIEEEKVDYLKTDTRLPAFLDDFIFNQLNAEYAPDFQRFEYNLDLTRDENLKYLGTYFPRSYSESFCIFDNIFQNINFQRTYSHNQSLNILSIGCGTGGDLIGLMTTIEKYFQQITELNIYALDGNAESLSILEKIIEKFKVQSSKNIKLRTIRAVFNSITNIDVQQFVEQKFDFILSFKLLSEIIAVGKGQLDNSYYDFVHKFLPMLSDMGLCVLLNVTTKPEHTTYNPILMNRQVNKALRELSEYRTLLPISCSIYSNECHVDCFYQQTFSVTHLKHTKDKSKVAYRIIARDKFVKQIVSIENDSKLIIHNDKFCPHTEGYQKLEDAYLLKNNFLVKIFEKSLNPIENHTPVPKVSEIEPVLHIQTSKDDSEIYKIETSRIGVNVVGKIDLSQFEKPKKEIKPNKVNYYIIDTNVFVEYPDIIAKINKSYHIILSAKVIDELDNLKNKLQNEEKKNVQRALKLINDNMEKREIRMDTANLKLLPDDFNTKSPDNFILSVAMKYKDENPILLTSDNGLQVKAKGMNITTITLKEFLKQSH